MYKYIYSLRMNAPVALMLFFTLFFNGCNKSSVSITSLTSEYLADPAGIDVLRPRLGWQLISSERGEKQTAYQVIVASSPDILERDRGDLWESGKIQSDQSNQLLYNGKELASRDQCYWKVRVWDMDGKKSDWSNTATWSMGLLSEDDWLANWIGYDSVPPLSDIAKMPIRNIKEGQTPFKTYLPSQYLRKDFVAEKKIKRASLYATAQGHVEMHLNGERVGDEYFTPGWTDYNKRIYYRTYDVTKLLNEGRNTIGAILGDGWFRGNVSILGQNQYGDKLRLLCQIHIDYDDGTSMIIASDDTWKASFGPIILSDMFEGEIYDARKELTGWDSPGFNDGNWHAVNTGSDIAPLIQAYPGVPVRPMQELSPVSITEPLKDTYVFDMGQNFSGWARLKVEGNAGDTIHMQFAEMLKEDGTVYTENLRSARAADNYILKGVGEEVWEPHFTFHGYRYVQVTGFREKPSPEAITGIVIYSDAPVTSSFECSNDMLNQLYSNILWGQLSNYLEVPTDCPQRDERMGWTGDTQVFMRTGTYNQDVAAFFTKWIVDLMDTQNEAGAFGQQAPVFHGHGSPAWADAGIICPWTMYEVYADTSIVARYYNEMKKYTAFCRSHGLEGRGGGFGDWLAVGSNTPRDLISAAYFGYTTSMMIEIAKALGKEEDVEKFQALLEEIKQNFQEKFIQPDGRIAGDSQTAYCLALHYDMLDDEQREMAAKYLVERIEAKDYHLSVGFVGVPILLPTLTEIGRSDLAYRIIQNTTYPSWGYSIEQGATTIWERWNSYTKKNGFGDAGMNSFNHYAYGSCGEWMFANMLGIDAAEPGYKKILMKPELGEGVTWAKGHYDSMYGRIGSSWKLTENTFNWEISVPPNTTAVVFVPGNDPDHILEGGRSVSDTKGIQFIERNEGYCKYLMEPGDYIIESKI